MTNRLLLSLAFLTASAVSAFAAAAGTGTLDVKLTGFATVDGQVRVALFTSEANYESGKMATGRTVAVSKDGVTVSFAGLKPGEYAIKLFHDLNGNGEMDTNLIGIPTEPYAFSNNAHGQYGPARWSAARFAVTAGANSQAITVE